MGIINTIDEVKDYVEVAAGLKFDNLKPALRIAERRNLLPLLSPDQHTVVETAYETAEKDANAIADAKIKDLALLIQEALANLALMYAVPRLSVSVSSSGINRLENDKARTAYQYQERNLIESYGRAGYDALEDMLELLESDSEKFSDWFASPAYKDRNKFFIKSGKQFSEYYQIWQSRLTYLALRPIMRRIEDFAVKQTVGTVLFAALKASTFTEKHLKLIDDFIKPAIALLTVSAGLIERALDITELGVTVAIIGEYNNSSLKDQAPTDKIKAAAEQLLNAGNEYLSRLAEYLEANAEDFPEYESPVAESRLFNIKNNKEAGIFGV